MLTETLKLSINTLIFPGGLFALFIGLILSGVDRKVAARLQRRVGPPIYQPFIDLVKLSYKEVMIPRTAHKMAFLLAPLIGFVSMFAAVVLIPIPGVYEGISPANDLIILLYLLAVPAIALMIAGSASSSPFGGIGFSREMIMVIAYEIPLVTVLITVALKVGTGVGTGITLSLTEIMQYQLAKGALISNLSLIPAVVALLCYIPGTMGVVPFDIPEAETEIVEGPMLEYSGVGLAFFKIMQALKLYIVLAMTIVLFMPSILPFGSVINLGLFLVKLVVLMLLVITLIRTATGRLRIDQAFKFYLFIPSSLAAISLVLTLLERG